MGDLRAEVLRLLAGRPTEEAMAAELRRRGYTVTPPEVIDLPGNGRLIAPVDLLNVPDVPDPIFDAMLREALGLPAEEGPSDG